jgi:hypothetical protein
MRRCDLEGEPHVARSQHDGGCASVRSSPLWQGDALSMSVRAPFRRASGTCVRLAAVDEAAEAGSRDVTESRGKNGKVRRSLGFGCVRSSDRKSPQNSEFERTGANGRERSLAFAMQKVEGSSPFIRSRKFLQISRFGCLSGKRHRGAWQGSLSFLPATTLRPHRDPETLEHRKSTKVLQITRIARQQLFASTHGRPTVNPPSAARRRRLQKVICVSRFRREL